MLCLLCWPHHWPVRVCSRPRLSGASLFEIRTEEAYPEDYEAHVELARRQRDAGLAPRLAASVENISAYRLVFLGFPI